MSILSTIKRIGFLPTIYKLKHLYLTPDPFIISQSSQNGAYEYLKRYKYAVPSNRVFNNLPTIKDTKYVWVCWLQGLDNAPLIIQRCVATIQRYNPNKKVVILSDDTIPQYVSVPEYIQKKYCAGNITRTHYSDIVRLLLLNQYGGIWIDSTIFMTNNIPSYVEESSFFVYHSASETGHVCCATGFMASCPHHPIIEDTLKMLLEYWQNENKLISYSVIHLLLFYITHESCRTNISYWNCMPLYYYTECEKLCTFFNKTYNSTTFESIKQCSPIHKLSYKDIDKYVNTNEKDTFYDVLINQKAPTC